jgi:putative ABC transport system permease protein
LYLLNALIYGALALVIALPLGAVVAFTISKIFLNMFNIDFEQFRISQQALFFQVLAALGAPLLAGLPPVLQGANITVRQAIASYGLGGDFHSGWLDRLVEGIGQRWLSSQYATALGNMFRHKGRLLLTQLVLITAGSAFLMVMSLNSSISLTIDNLYARRQYDTLIQFRGNQRAERSANLALVVPGVEKAELHLVQAASMFVSGQLIKEAGIGTNIEGIPDGSDFFIPLMVAGRWFLPGEGQVVVLTRDTAQKNHIQPGDVVTLDLGELGTDQWTVIGLYDPVFAGGFVSDTIYAPAQALYKATKKYNQGTMLFVRTHSHSAAAQEDMTQQLKDMYEDHGIKVVNSQTLAAARSTSEFQFTIVVWMMLALSIIVAIVGGIALMGALSIGVIERTKEIGVLRALGARSRTILSIFVMEGVLQGLLSWLIAIPISLAASPVMANALGQTMFGASLDYRYNWPALGIWFGIIAIISIVASILPARGATRISVRDSLAYA